MTVLPKLDVVIEVSSPTSAEVSSIVRVEADVQATSLQRANLSVPLSSS